MNDGATHVGSVAFSPLNPTTSNGCPELFRRGRTSLLIGVTFLAVSLLLGDFIAGVLGDGRFGELLRESLLIGGWVAMWRPMEIFLYESRSNLTVLTCQPRTSRR